MRGEGSEGEWWTEIEIEELPGEAPANPKRSQLHFMPDHSGHYPSRLSQLCKSYDDGRDGTAKPNRAMPRPPPQTLRLSIWGNWAGVTVGCR